VFWLNAGRLELLLIISVYLLCVTHLPASQLEGWSYNELNPNCLYADMKTKENPLLLDVICLKFLDQKSLLQLFLNCENSCMFPDPFFSFEKE
jgi:hypothetical protein